MPPGLPYPEIGLAALKRKPTDTQLKSATIVVVSTLSHFNMVAAIRAAVFMAEQDCPYYEEFDGNDFAGLHLLAFAGREPVATLRLRWFAGFGKVERVCVRPKFRGRNIERVLLAHAFEIGARKGYRLMIGQIQARLWPVWSKTLNCSLRQDRPSFHFSDYEYLEIDIPLLPHPEALSPVADPYVLIRPEGYWDEPGILDQPAAPRKDSKAA